MYFCCSISIDGELQLHKLKDSWQNCHLNCHLKCYFQQLYIIKTNNVVAKIGATQNFKKGLLRSESQLGFSGKPFVNPFVRNSSGDN